MTSVWHGPLKGSLYIRTNPHTTSYCAHPQTIISTLDDITEYHLPCLKVRPQSKQPLARYCRESTVVAFTLVSYLAIPSLTSRPPNQDRCPFWCIPARQAPSRIPSCQLVHPARPKSQIHTRGRRCRRCFRELEGFREGSSP